MYCQPPSFPDVYHSYVSSIMKIVRAVYHRGMGGSSFISAVMPRLGKQLTDTFYADGFLKDPLDG